MKSFHARLCFFLTVFCLHPVFAWNAMGHMVIANIAYQNLQPEVKSQVDQMVNNFQKEYPEMDAFLKIAYWPDTLHGQKIETYTRWHYIDIAISNDNSALKNLLESDNVMWAINNMATVVKNNHANKYERARFLAFLVHMVGDVHQPLHTVANISANHPDGDHGGNLYFVRYNNSRINLHKLWDSGLEIYSNDGSIDQVNTLTETITTQYPISYFGKKADDLSAENWVKESVENAKQYVYTTPEEQSISAAYVENGQNISEQVVALAGYRLANLLNQLLIVSK